MTEINNNSNELKSFKDIKSFEELDYSKIELIRGQTPSDIKERCLQLCKDYLSGNWSQQTLDSIEVNRITGGLMNQIYNCRIKEPNSEETVPQEVAVRLYGVNVFNFSDPQKIRERVISLIFSEQKLGPKMYGIFEGGMVQKFYKFKLEEQKNPKLVETVFKTMAKIHALNPPLKKNPIWIYDLMVRCYEEAQEKHPLRQYYEEYNLDILKNNDLKVEIDWIRGVIEGVESPVVFVHNDYRSSNLLITEPNDELVVCDYDFSGYCYRGLDFVPLMREWGRYQFETKQIEGLPVEDSDFIPMIDIYVKEMERINGKSYSENKINSVDHILKEMKIFHLFRKVFGTVWCLKIDEKDDCYHLSKKVCLETAEKIFEDYFKLKQLFKELHLVEY